MIRVALLDPHPVVHKGFKSFFRKTEHIQVVGTFSQANDLFHFLETNKIDALILEMELEGNSAVQVIKWVKSKLPETAIIIYTSLPQSIYGVSLLKAGAAGYLSKQVSRKVMLEAIEKVVGNGYHITSNFAKQKRYLAHKGNIHAYNTSNLAHMDCILANQSCIFCAIPPKLHAAAAVLAKPTG